MTMPRTAYEAFEDDEIEQAIPGCILTHVLTITSRDQLSVAIEALRAIRASGGGLEMLSLSRRSDTFEHRLKIVGIRSHQARLLAARLASLPGVDRASVEHQLLRM